MNRKFTDQLLRVLTLIFVFSIFPAQAITVDESNAEQLVKNAPCLQNESIDTILANKIKSTSQRDLGWQVFKEGDNFEVERAFLINKSMQLRFRWSIGSDGVVTPINKRTESLCQ